MNTDFTLTYDHLHQIFVYEDGCLVYKKRTSKRVKIGDKTYGYKRKDGYRTITIQYKPYYVHRIVFLMHNGYLPDFLDHIDGDRSNNKIENLRPCTVQQNAYNRTAIKTKNVSLIAATNKWQVTFKVNGKTKNYGSFSNKDEAILLATKLRTHLHKEFATT
jgi:pyruvate-formate lyase